MNCSGCKWKEKNKHAYTRKKNIPEVGGWRARGRGQAGREKKQMKNYVARWQKDEESSCLSGTYLHLELCCSLCDKTAELTGVPR